MTTNDFAFSPSSLELKSGKPTFNLVNGGGPHDMVIADAKGKVMARSKLVNGGNTTDFVTSNLPPGTYGSYCERCHPARRGRPHRSPG